MFQNPTRAKKLYFDIIPKMTDDYLRLRKDYEIQNNEEKLQNPIWFLKKDNEFKLVALLKWSYLL